MGGGKRLTPMQIAVITALSKAGHPNDYICNTTGVSARSVRRWVQRFKGSPEGDVQLQQKPLVDRWLARGNLHPPPDLTKLVFFGA